MQQIGEKEMKIGQSNKTQADWTACDRNQHFQRKKGNATFVKESQLSVIASS